MPSTSDASTASQYARMMVIQLNYDDFQPATISGTEYTALENLCYALSGTLAKKDAANFDTTLLNYIAVQYAQVSSLQNQATNDIVKTILGTDNKVTVYDRRLNDKLGPT